MKIKLSDHKLPLSSYTTIDFNPIIEEGKEDQFSIIKGDISNIDQYVERSDCTEILVDGLQVIQIEKLLDVINHWITKLRHGGKIIITSTNLESIIKQYLNGEITTLDFNIFMYGTQGEYKSCVCLDEVEEILIKAGLVIIHKQLADVEFTIVGQRK